MTNTQFLKAIDRYLAATGMTPTAFGVEALRDPTFVFRVRNGRKVRAPLQQRVLDFMAANPQGRRAA